MPLYIDRWLDRSKPDYYMMFVAAWIPFNAWYNHDIIPLLPPNIRPSDAACIDYICTHSNKYKDRLMYFLNDTGVEGIWMRKQIADLQRMLTLHPIPDAANPLNLSTIKVESNTLHLYETDFRGYHYKWEFVQNPVPPMKKYQLIVTKAGVTKCSLSIDKWIIADLTSHPDYTAIVSAEMKEKVVEYFKEINPRKPLDIIRAAVSDGHGGLRKPAHSEAYDETNHMYLDNNRDNVAKVIINLIYKLRCEIFHGSLDPSVNNLDVYEIAYNIQSKLIKALI